jgi:hypothetical protein
MQPTTVSIPARSSSPSDMEIASASSSDKENRTPSPAPLQRRPLSDRASGIPLASPRSARNVLLGPLGDIMGADTLRGLARTLADTCIQREDNYLAQLDQLREELAIARSQPYTDPILPPVNNQTPEGFRENLGLLPHFTIPTRAGRDMQARYVRLVETLPPKAAGTMGGPDDPIYHLDLHAQSHLEPHQPATPLAGWFLEAIKARASLFTTVMEEARRLDDWGLVAEIARYNETDARIVQGENQMRALNAQVEGLYDARQQTRYRLERARAADRLRIIEGQAKFDDGFPMPSPSRRADPKSSRGRLRN